MSSKSVQVKVTTVSNTVATPSYWKARSVPSPVSTPTLSNWRTSEFFDIVHLLEQMAGFDADDDFFVGKTVKDRAVKILTYVKDFHSIEFPKILPEGENCLSFTWDKRGIKSFLTVYADEIESTTYNKKSGIRCIQTLSEKEDIDYNNISNVIAGSLKSQTVDIL